MPKVNSQGVQIDYESVGDGPPIVLVHGFASSREGNWRRAGWLDRLTGSGRRVVALDCRGHGRSDKPHEPGAYDGHAMSEDVVAVMDAAGVEQADLMGYSMGGAIALDLVVRYPERFQSVIIGGAGLREDRADTERRQAIGAALLADDPATITDPTALGFRRFAERSDNDLRALAAIQRSQRARPDEEALRRVRIPILIVVGEKDDALRGAERLAALVPGAELVVVPGGDHLSTVGDARYKDAVSAFLDKHAPVAAL